MTKNLQVQVPQALLEALEQRAEREARSLDAIVEEILAARLASKLQKTTGVASAAAIRRGLTNKQTLRLVREEFPDSGISASSVSLMRTLLRKAGEPVPTNLEAQAATGAK